MKNFLSQDDLKNVEAKIKTFESNTGCELLLVVAKESDDYPAASMRFGVISAFIISLIFSHYFHFEESWLWPVSYFAIAWAMIFVGQMDWAKRFALSDVEIDRETHEKAIELFHTHGSSKVSHHVTAMIMVSVIERRIQILVDKRLKDQLSQTELDDLVLIMQKHFKEGNMGSGFIASIQSLQEKILKDFGGKVSQVNPSELQDTVIFI